VVLLSCGSFNPPTNAHLRMFELAAQELQQVAGPFFSLPCAFSSDLHASMFGLLLLAPAM
jgi:nicotinic acid mononucleotide adenylyltransferase